MKEKRKFFEEPEFQNVDSAKSLYEKEQKSFKLKIICAVIAAIGTVACLLGVGINVEAGTFLEKILFGIFAIGVIASLVAGGVIKNFKILIASGLLGKRIIPFYLIDLIGLIAGLFLALQLFFFLPVVPTLIFIYQSRLNMKRAEEYINSNSALNSISQ